MKTKLSLIMMLLLALMLVACGSDSGGDMEAIDDHSGHGDHSDHGDDAHGGERIPNNGVAISIVEPADGSEFASSDEINVVIEAENFDLSQDTNHWHIYVDGESLGMVVGGDTNFYLRDLAPGEREIAVYLADSSHVEFEDGATIMVNISE